MKHKSIKGFQEILENNNKRRSKKSLMTSCKNAGIPYGRKEPNGMTFHDIRRTVKTNMLKAGIDQVYRDLILGHSLKGIDVHYIAPTENDIKKEMGKYYDWLKRRVDN